MSLLQIDLNADVGEGFATDADVLDIVTSANIACGYHAGDRDSMRAAWAASADRGVSVGAHPGLPDREGFGRRPMELSPSQVYDLIVIQIDALAALAAPGVMPLTHVKPHGELYWMAESDDDIAVAIVDAVRTRDPKLALVGLSGGRLVRIGQRLGLRTVREIFADRAYCGNGTLVARSQPDAVISDAQHAARRLVGWAVSGRMPTIEGGQVTLEAETICVHGDGPQAVAIARDVRSELEHAGIRIAAFDVE